MNSKKMWKMLENMETKDIRTLVDMSIRYLEYNRKINFKKIIKDIKNTKKSLDVRYSYE